MIAVCVKLSPNATSGPVFGEFASTDRVQDGQAAACYQEAAGLRPCSPSYKQDTEPAWYTTGRINMGDHYGYDPKVTEPHPFTKLFLNEY